MTAKLARRLVAMFCLIVLFSGCVDEGAESDARGHTGSSDRLAEGALPRPEHVVIVVEENKAYSKIVGSSRAPFINQLAAEGASFQKSYGVAHPSQPNYLALFSGSAQGVTSDRCLEGFTGANLASELEQAGLRFTQYSQSLPHVGFAGCDHGSYKRKHNPAVNWQGDSVTPEQNRPFSDFPSNFDELPTVALVMPNQDYDMHDGSIAVADRWLKKNLGRYAQWATRHNSLLIVTWDEDNSEHDNHIATIVVGSMVQSGESSQVINHYSILRTLEDMYSLPLLGESAYMAPITDIWSKAEAAESGAKNQ